MDILPPISTGAPARTPKFPITRPQPTSPGLKIGCAVPSLTIEESCLMKKNLIIGHKCDLSAVMATASGWRKVLFRATATSANVGPRCHINPVLSVREGFLTPQFLALTAQQSQHFKLFLSQGTGW
jgi:hypothetical protein